MSTSCTHFEYTTKIVNYSTVLIDESCNITKITCVGFRSNSQPIRVSIDALFVWWKLWNCWWFLLVWSLNFSPAITIMVFAEGLFNFLRVTVIEHWIALMLSAELCERIAGFTRYVVTCNVVTVTSIEFCAKSRYIIIIINLCTKKLIVFTVFEWV